jgi:hypothetical protein
MKYASHLRGNAKLRTEAVYAAATLELLGGRELGHALARPSLDDREMKRQEGSNSVKRQLGLGAVKAALLTRTEGAHGSAEPQSPAPALAFRA